VEGGASASAAVLECWRPMLVELGIIGLVSLVEIFLQKINDPAYMRFYGPQIPINCRK